MHGSINDFVGAFVWTPLALCGWYGLATSKPKYGEDPGLIWFVLICVLAVTAADGYCIGRLLGFS